MLRYELNAKVCGRMKGLLRMYGVMELHIVIELLYNDFGHEQDLIRIYKKGVKNMYK